MSYLISILITLIGWATLTSTGEGLTANLEGAGLNTELAEKISEPMIISSLFSASLIAVIAYTWMYQKSKLIFWVTAILAFCLSEPAIPIVHELSLGLRYLFLATIIGILAHNAPQGSGTNKLAIPLILFGGVVIASSIINIDQGTAATSLAGLLIIGIIAPLILPYQLSNQVKELEDAFLYAFSLLSVIFATALIANPHAFVAGRFCSWFILPTNFGNLCSLMCIYFLWYATNNALAKKKRLIATLSLTVCLIMLVLSGTRNGMFSFVIATLLITLLIDKKVGLKILASIAVISLILAPSLTMREQIQKATERFFMVRDKESRDEVWNIAIDKIKESGFLGYGINITAGNDSKRTINPHNTLLGNYLRFGVLGAISVLLIYLIIIFQAFFQRETQKDKNNLIVLSQIMTIILFISGMFEDNYSGGVGVYQFLIAIFISLSQAQPNKIVSISNIHQQTPVLNMA